MAEEEAAQATEDAEQTEKVKKKGLSGKKLVLFIVLPVLLIGGGVGGAMAFGVFDSLFGGEKAAEEGKAEEGEKKKAENAVYYNLPDLLVNLNSEGRKTHYLKLSIALEIENQADSERLQAVLPRIIDNFQVYLRELRVEDLRGAAGIYRLREELLMRVNAAARPVKVNDVLFKEMLVQ